MTLGMKAIDNVMVMCYLGNHDVYRLVCDTKEEKDEWIKSIQASVAKASIHDTLKEKRQKLTNDLQVFDYLYFTPS